MTQAPPVFYKSLGQIYNGEIGKGILFMILYGFSFILMIVVIGFITTPILFIYGIWDAYSSAERINRWIAQSQGGPDSGPAVH
jgi:TM2 domain-containing membrane protein YozV